LVGGYAETGRELELVDRDQTAKVAEAGKKWITLAASSNIWRTSVGASGKKKART
jgi:hypothetical protein